MKRVPRELLEFVENYGTFYVIGHKEPDGDCIGSQLALASFLKRQGKNVSLLSAGPFTRTEVMPYEHRFSQEAPEEKASERAAGFILDCSSLGRIGSIAQTLPSVPLAFIDHHASGEASGQVVFIDDQAPSVTLMVLALIEALGQAPTKEEAEYLLFGLSTDSGFFRHIDETGAETFAAASRLIAAGASPKKAFAQMSGGKSLLSRRLLGEILARTEPYFDGRLLVSFVNLEDQNRFGQASRDSDMVYQLLFGVAGCEAAMVIRQESETDCTVGFRARDRIDVGSIAARFGGGGHRLAAGALIRGKIEEVRDKLIAAFESSMPEE